MAKISKIEANKRREKLAKRYAKKRAELRKTIKSLEVSDEEKIEAIVKLQSLPRNSAQIRVRNRCKLTGRPRAYLRKFGLSRIQFRELAHQGMIPGVTKSSW